MTIDTSPAARHRRLQTALRVLKEHDRRGGRALTSKAVNDPKRRPLALTLLAGAVMNEERKGEERL